MAQQRIERRNHGLLCTDIEREDLCEFLGIGMWHRTERSEHRCIQHHDVELFPALGNRLCQSPDAFRVGQVERGNRRGTTRRMNPLFNLLKASRSASGQDDMRAFLAQCCGRCRADAARGARDKRNLSLEQPRH